MTKNAVLCSGKFRGGCCNVHLIVVKKAMVRQGMGIHNGENRIRVENE